MSGQSDVTVEVVSVEDELSMLHMVPPSAAERAGEFRDFFAGNWAGAFRLAGLMGADDPENVAQEAFARLHPRFPRLDDGVQAQRYLRATVCNLSRSSWRRRRVAQRALPLLVRSEVADPATAVSDADAVISAMAELSARQREVIVLRFWLELSEAEIAETLGISAGSVKVHASRGMQSLRRKLEP